jgi:hypothetical protein
LSWRTYGEVKYIGISRALLEMEHCIGVKEV